MKALPRLIPSSRNFTLILFSPSVCFISIHSVVAQLFFLVVVLLDRISSLFPLLRLNNWRWAQLRVPRWTQDGSGTRAPARWEAIVYMRTGCIRPVLSQVTRRTSTRPNTTVTCTALTSLMEAIFLVVAWTLTADTCRTQRFFKPGKQTAATYTR